MNFINKLERRFGRYAIHELSKYLIIIYIAGSVIGLFSSVPGNMDIYTSLLALNPYLILQGQVWRLFTFLLAMPTTSIIWLIFVLLCYYNIARQLEYIWGDFRFNLYILTGVLGIIIGAFALYFLTGSPYIYMDTYYLNLSLFLAYAASFPDAQFYIYGIIPVKAKWLGILDGVLLGYSFITGGLAIKVAIAAALMNFLLFFFGTRNYHKYSPKQAKRRNTYIKEVKMNTSVTRHRCHVCGRTELDDPNLEFRYCSKCDGNYEYCSEHLFTHTHVKNNE